MCFDNQYFDREYYGSRHFDSKYIDSKKLFTTVDLEDLNGFFWMNWASGMDLPLESR